MMKRELLLYKLNSIVVPIFILWSVMIQSVIVQSHVTSRRSALASVSTLCVLETLLPAAPTWASISQPLPNAVVTVVLDSPTDKAGIQVADKKTGSSSILPYVKMVDPEGLASRQGVVEGMIVLQGSSASSVVKRLQSGPYPLALQFYNMGVEYNMNTALDGLEAYAQEMQQRTNAAPPQLSTKGAGLITKTVRKGSNDCTRKPKRGDTVTISYEARVASPGGPLYDSSDNKPGGTVTFVLGDGQAIPGVDIGVGGMCPGEIKTLDIPAGLGYGKGGSTVFDIPGDVRLWWKVELIDVMEGEKRRSPFR